MTKVAKVTILVILALFVKVAVLVILGFLGFQEGFPRGAGPITDQLDTACRLPCLSPVLLLEASRKPPGSLPEASRKPPGSLAEACPEAWEAYSGSLGSLPGSLESSPGKPARKPGIEPGDGGGSPPPWRGCLSPPGLYCPVSCTRLYTTLGTPARVHQPSRPAVRYGHAAGVHCPLCPRTRSGALTAAKPALQDPLIFQPGK